LLAAVVLAVISTALLRDAGSVGIILAWSQLHQQRSQYAGPDLYPENPSSALNLASASFSSDGRVRCDHFVGSSVWSGASLLLVAGLMRFLPAQSYATFPHGFQRRTELESHRRRC